MAIPLPTLLAFTIIWIACAPAVWAQDPAPKDPATDTETPGDTVIVEGGSDEVRPEISEAPPPYSGRFQPGGRTLITRERFEGSQKTVADVLETVPGVSLTRGGDRLSPTRVTIRGSKPGQVLIVLDGVPLNGEAANPAQAGRQGRDGVDLSTLPLERVESIEVVRGAASSLHGPGAAAGAVIIRTRKPGAARIGLGLTRGSGGYGEADVQWDRPGEDPETDWSFTLGANHRRSRGEYLYYDPNAYAGGNLCAEPQGDGYFLRRCNRKQITHLDLGWRANAGTELGVALTHSLRENPVGVENYWLNGREEKQRIALRYQDRLRYQDSQPMQPLQPVAGDEEDLDAQPREVGWKASVQAQKTYRSSNLNQSEALSGDFVDYRAEGGLWWEGWQGRQQLRLGTDAGRQVLHDHLFRARRDSNAAYANWTLHRDAGAMEASVRHDVITRLDPATTWRAGLSESVWRGLGVKASQATGFRPPTLFEWYGNDPASGLSGSANPDLKPEQSTSTDGGVFWEGGKGAYVEVLGFRQEATDDIVAVGAGSGFKLVNLDATRTTGVEMTLNLSLAKGLTLDGSLTRMTPRIITANDSRHDGNLIPGQPRLRWKASLEWKSGRTRAGVNTAHVGDRFISEDNVRYLRAYRLWNAEAVWPFMDWLPGKSWSKGLEAGLEIRNLTNQTYLDMENMPPPGREVFFTLRWESGGE